MGISNRMRDFAAAEWDAPMPDGTSTPASNYQYRYTTDLYLEWRTLRVDMVSPERRLSDYLNGFLPCVDVQPSGAEAPVNETAISYSDPGCVTKTSLLFVIPVVEPTRQSGSSNPAWRATVKRGCRAEIGRWSISGHIHLETANVSAGSLRLLEKQFMPITGATIARDGEVVSTDVVAIVNRFRVDALFVESVPSAYSPSSR